MANDALIASGQYLLDQIKADLNFTQGEVTMFIPDMPNVPPQDVPMMIAQANQIQQGATVTERRIGVCQPIGNMLGVAPNLTNTISPKIQAKIYFNLYEHQKVDGPATVTVLQNPKHGALRLVTEADRGILFSRNSGPTDPANPLYVYLPEQGYLGNDSVTMLVDIGGKTVKEVYYFKVVDHPVNNDGDREICKKGPFWKISSALDANGNSTITSVEYQSPFTEAGTSSTDTAALASTLGSSILSGFAVDTSSITLNIADLVGGAVGQAVGNTITLDDNAAGHNWFIDTSPADNSEFLPTSNPGEWVAKAGTAAYGKMDMLSVLLHEYGHALGIDHSADGHDYMATTLTPGVRRMPSAEELVLMQQLIGVAKDGLASNE